GTAVAAGAGRVAWWLMRMLGRKGQRRSGTGPGSPAGRLGSCAACGAVDHHDRAMRGIHAMQAHRAEVRAKEPCVSAPADHQYVGLTGLRDQQLGGVPVDDRAVDIGARRVRGPLADRLTKMPRSRLSTSSLTACRAWPP